MENLTLTGAAAINGTGNAQAINIAENTPNNQLIGAAGNDILNGGTGTNVLRGGTSNDIFGLQQLVISTQSQTAILPMTPSNLKTLYFQH